LPVDVFGVVVDRVERCAEGLGDLFVGVTRFEEACHCRAFFGGFGLRERVVLFLGELGAVVDVVLFVNGFDVCVDGA
jgi:hypothetical protein